MIELGLYKHFIRVDVDNYITYAFSDAFEQPEEGDIHYLTDGRHFHLQYSDVMGTLLLKYIDGEIVNASS